MKSISSAIVICAGIYGLHQSTTALMALQSTGNAINVFASMEGGQAAQGTPGVSGGMWMYLLLIVSLLLIILGFIRWWMTSVTEN